MSDMLFGLFCKLYLLICIDSLQRLSHQTVNKRQHLNPKLFRNALLMHDAHDHLVLFPFNQDLAVSQE